MVFGPHHGYFEDARLDGPLLIIRPTSLRERVACLSRQMPQSSKPGADLFQIRFGSRDEAEEAR